MSQTNYYFKHQAQPLRMPDPERPPSRDFHLFFFFFGTKCICNPDIATNSVCFQVLTLAICLRGKIIIIKKKKEMVGEERELFLSFLARSRSFSHFLLFFFFFSLKEASSFRRSSAPSPYSGPLSSPHLSRAITDCFVRSGALAALAEAPSFCCPSPVPICAVHGVHPFPFPLCLVAPNNQFR